MIIVAPLDVITGQTPAPEVSGPRTTAGPLTVALSWSWSAPWLGRSWDLTDLTSPVVKLKGATGTGQVDPEHWWADAPTLDGSSWEGSRTGRGEVVLPLMIHAPDSATFAVEHDDFMRSLDPRREGFLRVTRPDGRWREIACRYQSGADSSIDLDPMKACLALYGIAWATADPYWSGEPVEVRYENTSVAPLFPGPPFAIGKADALADAVVSNPGDVDAYPVWRVEGPFSGFSVGVGSALVEATLTKVAGEWVEIDMHPRTMTVLDDAGRDVWDDGSVTAIEFSAIGPGNSDLVTALYGAGAGSAVSLTFTPRYRRAW